MISKQVVGQAVLVGVIAFSLGGCDRKKEPIKTEATQVQAAQTPQDSTGKTENDVYIEKLNKDVKVDNPDALLDEVNKESSKSN